MKINFENEILITEKTFKPNLPGFLNLAGLVFVFNIRNKDKLGVQPTNCNFFV